jgi:putative FmdB family regulatory protein
LQAGHAAGSCLNASGVKMTIPRLLSTGFTGAPSMHIKYRWLRYNTRFLNIGLLEVSMPIYEYLCNSCGAEKEHLQKISDAPIAVCPVCGSSNYVKRISAAGFQLKGSGWYVTDFKNNKAKQTDTKPAAKESTQSAATAAPDTAAPKESSSAPATAAD